MWKRIFIILITAIALVSAIAAASVTAEQKADAETITKYFYIDSEADWEDFVKVSLKQGETSVYKDTIIELRTDLYFYRRNATENLPKNYIEYYFEGTFEGNGHYLIGLNYNFTGETQKGLFYRIGENGVVRNLNIVDASINGISGGLCGINDGLIENVKIQGKINATSAGGIAHINSVKGTIRNCVTAVEYLGTGDFGSITCLNANEVTNNHNILFGVQIFDNYASDKHIMPANSLIDDGLINDYYELFYLKANPALDVKLASDINLFNQELNWINTAITADHLGSYYFYNNDCYDAVLPIGFEEFITPSLLPQLEDLVISGTGEAGDPYILFSSGEGTVNNPYKIASVLDLQRIEYLYANKEDWASFGLNGKLYFKQTADISLLKNETEFYDLSITDFDGEYDGSGKSITGLINSIFESVLPDGFIKDLNVRGEIRTSGEALIVKNNSGRIENCYVKAEIIISSGETAGAIVHNNSGMIWLCEAVVSAIGDGNYGAIAYENAEVKGATIAETRSISSEVPFVFYSLIDNLWACYNEGSIWVGSDTGLFPPNCFANYGGEQYYGSTNPYEVLDKNNIYSGWQWGSVGFFDIDFVPNPSNVMVLNWCVLAGSEEDVFFLRRPSDKKSYKTSGRLDIRYDIFYISDNIMQRDVTYREGGYNTIVKADWFETNYEFNDQLSYNWTFRNLKNGDIEEYGENNFVGPIEKCGTYKFDFVMQSTLTKTKLSDTIIYNINPIKIDYNLNDFRIKNDVDKTLNTIFGVNSLYPTVDRTIVVEGVEYVFSANGVKINNQFYTFAGDVSQATYTATEFSFAELKPFYAPANAVYTYEITKYVNTRGDNILDLPGFARSAGSYTIKVTISCENYVTAEVEGIIIKILPKSVGVTPYIEGGKLPYGEALANYVNYRINQDDIFEPLTIDNLAEMTFNSNYRPSESPVGNYNLTSIVVKGLNNNYVAYGTTAKFDVIKLNIEDLEGYENIKFEDKTMNYDGNYHSIAVSGLSGDFAVRYYYGGSNKHVPYEFINAGVYNITAEIYIKTQSGGQNNNYNPAPNLQATLIIARKEIRVEVKSYTINYKDAPPKYEIYDFSHQIVTRADLVKDVFEQPQFSCDYTLSSKAGVYIIGLTGVLNDNYSVIAVSGRLTVNKIHRGTLTIANPLTVYNGEVFVPEFTTEMQAEISSLPINYYLKDSAAPLDGAPKNAGSYTIKINFLETDNYLQETLAADFEIAKASLNIRFLLNGQEGKLDSSLLPSSYVNSELVYGALRPTVRIEGLPAAESYTAEYRYTINGEEFLSDKANRLELANAGLYSNIYVIVSGNPNYNDITLYAGAIEYKPKVLRLIYTNTATYNTQKILLDLGIRNYNESVLEEDKLTVNEIFYTSYLDEVPTEIKSAGKYLFTARVLNTNYVVVNDDNSQYFAFNVEKYQATIDFMGKSYEVNYGMISGTFNMLTEYYVGNYKEETMLTYNVAPASGVGTYNVISINETRNVKFFLINGEKKYIVNPKTVSFDWKLLPSYSYNGTERTDIKGLTVLDRDVINREGSDAVGVRFIFDKQVIRDVGIYNVNAYLVNKNYTLTEQNSNFSFEITKAVLTVNVNDIIINYNSPLPQFSAQIIGLLGDDASEVISLTYGCAYVQGADIGIYPILINSFEADNYLCDISQAEGILTVLPLRQTGIEYPNLQVVYNGQPYTYLPKVSNNNSQVSVDLKPVNAGTYTLTATVKLANHIDEVVTATLTINPSLPTVVLTPANVTFIADNQKLNSDIIQGTANFNLDNVDGVFEFEPKEPILLLGENTYPIVFIPSNANFKRVNLQYRITSVIEDIESKINLVFITGTLKDKTIHSTSDTVMLGVSVDRGIDDNVKMYANGVLVQSGILEVKEGQNTINIEIKKDEILLTSYSFNILYNQQDPDDIDDGDDGGNNGGNNGGGSGGGKPPEIPVQKHINWQLIGGIAGGAAGGISLIVIVIIVINKIRARREG